MEQQKLYTNISIEKKPASEVEITGEIPVEIIEAHRGKALTRLGKNLSVAGFRKGHIPHDILTQRLGEPAILQETAELVLTRAYADIIIEHNINVIGRPAITLTKLAPANPIGFKILTAVMPEVALPDYKNIAAEKRKEAPDTTSLEVTDKELDNVILEIRKSHTHAKYHEAHPEEETHDHGEIKDDDLPQFTDAFAQGLGNFENVDDFKAKVRENMRREKELREREKLRTSITDEIIEQTKIEVPTLFIESELEKMRSEFRGTVSRMGLTLEDYLERTQKTEASLREEWHPEAKKRAMLQLVLNKIAIEEKIEPDQAQVEREAAHIIEHYPEVNPDNVRTYVDTMLTNEKVFQFLEHGREETDIVEDKKEE